MDSTSHKAGKGKSVLSNHDDDEIVVKVTCKYNLYICVRNIVFVGQPIYSFLTVSDQDVRWFINVGYDFHLKRLMTGLCLIHRIPHVAQRVHTLIEECSSVLLPIGKVSCFITKYTVQIVIGLDQKGNSCFWFW